jgi:hypothetical protein
MTYTPRTDEEIRELAEKIVTGQAIHNQQVPQDLWTLVFLPLAFVEPNQTQDLFGEAALIYGETDSAGPRTVNGFPVFGKISILNQADLERLKARLDVIKAALA